MAKKDVINDFTKIQGVGKAKAEALFSKGFDSLDKLKKANVKELTKVEGITENIAKNIKKQFEQKPTKQEPKKDKVKEQKPKEEKPTKEKNLHLYNPDNNRLSFFRPKLLKQLKCKDYDCSN